MNVLAQRKMEEVPLDKSPAYDRANHVLHGMIASAGLSRVLGEFGPIFQQLLGGLRKSELRKLLISLDKVQVSR